MFRKAVATIEGVKAGELLTPRVTDAMRRCIQLPHSIQPFSSLLHVPDVVHLDTEMVCCRGDLR